jgi:hypothetical protein
LTASENRVLRIFAPTREKVTDGQTDKYIDRKIDGQMKYRERMNIHRGLHTKLMV